MVHKFINRVTATNSLKVGEGLAPCTKRVQHVPHRSESGRIIFVDTPAFPDPDAKKPRTPQDEIRRIENEIGKWMKERFGGGRVQVTGILYLYNIHQRRMTNPPRPHFEMFKKLCGDDYTGHVLLVATMWETVKAEELRKKRKAELMKHWGDMVVEHHGTQESARSIVNTLLHPGRGL
ncbi:hypothetical protein M413DRAFT_438927, partial [Hebeloma cylindrosporum]